MPEDKKQYIENPYLNPDSVKQDPSELESTETRQSENGKIEKRDFESLNNTVDLEQTEGEIGTVKVQASSKGSALTEEVKKVEDVLSEDVLDFYVSMDDKRKAEFKRVGESTAKKIVELRKETKVKVKLIINLIKKWLLIIPGVNKYFVEQEAKIKADKILRMNK